VAYALLSSGVGQPRALYFFVIERSFPCYIKPCPQVDRQRERCAYQVYRHHGQGQRVPKMDGSGTAVQCLESVGFFSAKQSLNAILDHRFNVTAIKACRAADPRVGMPDEH
jgi:hypothetical protein